MSLHDEIRNRISCYLAGGISLDEFREWLAPRAWNIHKREDEDTARTVYRIEAVLSECSYIDQVDNRQCRDPGKSDIRSGPTIPEPEVLCA